MVVIVGNIIYPFLLKGYKFIGIYLFADYKNSLLDFFLTLHRDLSWSVISFKNKFMALWRLLVCSNLFCSFSFSDR